MAKGTFIVGFMLLSGLLLARDPANDISAEASKLIAMENAWNQAQLHHDAKAVSSLVADGFVYTDYDGTVMNKGEFLADLKDPDYRASLIANDDVRVISYVNAAIVVGTYHTKEPTNVNPSSTMDASPTPGFTRTTSGSAWPVTPI